MAEFTRPYLDATCWIEALLGSDAGRTLVAPILEAVDEGKIGLVVSSIMPLEVLGGSSTGRTMDTEAAALAALQRTGVIEVPVSRGVVLRARELRISHNLDSMDALHLASAVRGRADAFLTSDKHVLALSRLDAMDIQEPAGYGQPRIF